MPSFDDCLSNATMCYILYNTMVLLSFDCCAVVWDSCGHDENGPNLLHILYAKIQQCCFKKLVFKVIFSDSDD